MNKLRPFLVLLFVMLSAASPARAQHPEWLTRRCFPPSSPTPRIERLRDWLDAVARHEAGQVDEPAARILGWPNAALVEAQLHLRSLVTLIRRPNTRTFYDDPDPGDVRFFQRPRIRYSDAEMEALEGLACGLAHRSTPDRLLLRGALLHTDIALAAARLRRFAPAEPRAGSPRAVPRHLAVSMFEFEDGRIVGEIQVLSHWALARTLLEGVSDPKAGDDRPHPGRHPAVRLWYRASLAVMHRLEHLERQHFQRALELFPTDAEILTLAGAFHELLAGQRMRGAFQAARVAQALGASTEANELRRAEWLYRDALRADPAHVEARIRRGRVLGLLGRSGDALAELSQAIPRAGDMEPPLRYYARLFFAREAAAVGRRDEARASYEQAAALYPRAQTPHLGLSELSTQAGDRGSALAVLQPVLLESADGLEHDDPWWSYGSFAGRHAESWLEAAYAAFPGSLESD